MGKNFLLDAEALTFTRDLLSYYLKKVCVPSEKGTT